ncbi:hypothetical protein BHE74_00032887, partial [Ensete ventricosum]
VLLGVNEKFPVSSRNGVIYSGGDAVNHLPSRGGSDGRSGTFRVAVGNLDFVSLVGGRTRNSDYIRRARSCLFSVNIVQRQLQLRIEAQGKYLKKIIDEQQRLSGVLAELPGADVPAPASGDHCPDSEKTDPSTPAPTSESPGQDKAIGREHGDANEAFKSISCDDSFSSRREPLTPDSGCHVSSPSTSPRHENSAKRLRVSSNSGRGKAELLLAHILESSSGSEFHQ